MSGFHFTDIIRIFRPQVAMMFVSALFSATCVFAGSISAPQSKNREALPNIMVLKARYLKASIELARIDEKIARGISQRIETANSELQHLISKKIDALRAERELVIARILPPTESLEFVARLLAQTMPRGCRIHEQKFATADRLVLEIVRPWNSDHHILRLDRAALETEVDLKSGTISIVQRPQPKIGNYDTLSLLVFAKEGTILRVEWLGMLYGPSYFGHNQWHSGAACIL